jgi:Zn-dependent protease with chaperone function
MRFLAPLAALMLGACQISLGAGPGPVAQPPVRAAPATRSDIDPRIAGDTFATVVRLVEPVAEQVCRERLRRGNCDFRVIVDSRGGIPPNAYQTLDDRGRPVIGFTLALIRQAQNADELAFVLGHEAGHHIRGHIPQTQNSATQGAVLGTIFGRLGGFDDAGVDTLSRIGATVGARRYSKDFELQADALGTLIAARAGYDPVRGAQFFTRIPDPGDRFLGTHPPNAERIRVVRRTAAGL